ncbi:hypothetical protein EMGBS3_13090 [Anaerolineaceae bacterium]|nr:hypothetical protein EMGBS3_13090 [Anaerolineaceae bacterium]
MRNWWERIAAATAAEMLPTGVTWNFGPVVAVAQDIRWGRTYESFSEQPQLVTELGAAYVRGLQAYGGGQALATQSISLAMAAQHGCHPPHLPGAPT